MILEIGLITLLNFAQPNLLGQKAPDILRPFFNVGISQTYFNYQADISTSGKTLSYEADIGYKINDNFSFGYKSRAFDVGNYGKSGDYVFLKVSYKFDGHK